MKRTVEQRFWAKVAKGDDGGCWLWTGAKQAGCLYGYFSVGGRNCMAHRFAYELLVGEIPEGLQLDHLCRVPACVNPAHLEPVTCKENLLRGETLAAANSAKTHCLRGHAFDVVNTHRRRNGRRECRACMRDRTRRQRATH